MACLLPGGRRALAAARPGGILSGMDIDARASIERLAATASTLAHLVAEVQEARLQWSEDGGGWSPRTILAHLRDDE